MAIAAPNGTILEANRKYAELLGRPVREILGRSFADFTHPDDVRRGVAARDSALQGDNPIVHIEKRYRRPDGSDVWCRVTSTLQRDSAGRPLQFIAQIEDLADRRRADAALQQREAQYRTLVEHAPEAIVVLDVDAGRFIDANCNAERLFKMSRAELLQAGPAALRARAQPNDTGDERSQEEHIADALNGATTSYQRVLRDSAGREFFCELRLVRLPAEGNRLIRASIFEITERKQTEVRQQRLIRELNHRVKNTLSSVLTLAQQSILRARSLEEFDRGFAGRLTAMSRAHEALTSARWEQIELDALVHLILGPHMVERGSRCMLGGERILLPARAVVPLGMALHELATNALKHGPLATGEGRVDVRWREVDRAIELTWAEQNPRRAKGPMREGTGIELIRGFIAYELGGTARFDPQPDSFTASLRIPLDR